ncbi:ABC transporter ATP-binding protein [Catenovulum sp. SM1970]|uniref:ATP-binding cassette ATPase Uup n=1 Tax=Marinifaba aquimaris TaxID=2741323 RepID=UPI001572B11B|nr:ABC transporter ATP-binding protein [Marinifaba aquimaris]NTS77355.1 ABC transporter ATP-binding protein [Marinifaba aquimaris]
MNLYRITKAQLAFGDHALLDNADFHINQGERVCIVGRNGAGKSTLLKVIDAQIKLDDGDINIRSNTEIKRLEQDPPKAASGTVYQYVAQGLGEAGSALAAYHQEMVNPDCDMDKLARLQQKVEQLDAWSLEPQIQQIISRLSLNSDACLTDLSGGWLRKVALARALVSKPDILLLDEPTNHLDYQSIAWLEDFLLDYTGAIVFISHDRAFIRKVATRIVDLDRGKLVNYEVGYDTYLEQKADNLRIEEEQNKQFDKVLAQEEAWIRQGIKARRTRNEGRVRALKALRNERKQRREVQGKVSFNLEEVKRSGKLVAELTNLTYGFENQLIVKDFSSLIMRGDKVALIGPNGCGKSTLINLILEKIKPQDGNIRVGTNLQVAYFDQYREQLDEEKTVLDNVGDGKEDITVNGKSRHVLGYLQDFLFSPKRARSPVKSLSGGEKNRLLLAKLFLKESNFLVLDEPTNDLDVETLELLEELVSQYPGTLILVSHDREFVNNTATSTYFFAGDGAIEEYVGGYESIPKSKLIENRQEPAKNDKSLAHSEQNTQTAVLADAGKSKKQTKAVKLSYKQQRQLDALPAQIEELETKIETLQTEINSPEFFNQDVDKTQASLSELEKAESELEVAFELWEELEAIVNESKQ